MADGLVKPQVGQIWHTKKPFKWPTGPMGQKIETWYEIIKYIEIDFEWMRRQKRFFICNQYTYDTKQKKKYVVIHYHSKGFFMGKNLELAEEVHKVAKMYLFFTGKKRYLSRSMEQLIVDIKKLSKNGHLKKGVQPLSGFPTAAPF
jgi:hypothetical protein